MKTKDQNAAAGPVEQPAVRIFGVGSAGVALLERLDAGEFAGAGFVAVNTDAASLAASSAAVKLQLETKLLRGLGSGGDPERGRALAEEHFATLKSACDGAKVALLIAGLGGGAGSGISPVLARAARESGALVLAFVTLPFGCEGNRRIEQAQQGLEQLRSAADGVICLPNQKASKLMDDHTSLLETFDLTGRLLLEGVRGVWRLLTRPGLIQIHFDDLCAMVRDRHSESVFAFVEASGPARSREAMEKLIAHPLLEEGRALAEADAVLVSLTGGKDLTMAEVSRLMEQIGRYCEQARVIMGASVDAEMKNRLSVTVIAGRNAAAKSETPAVPDGEAALPEIAPRGAMRLPAEGPATLPGHREAYGVRQGVRGRRTGGKMLQTQLPLAIVSKGRFDKSEPTIHKGEDLDIPTYVRRGVALN